MNSTERRGPNKLTRPTGWVEREGFGAFAYNRQTDWTNREILGRTDSLPWPF